MMIVKFYDEVDDSLLKFAVIITKTNGKLVFCKQGKVLLKRQRENCMRKQVLKNMILDQFVYILLLPQIISMVKKLLECYFMRMFFLLKKNYIVK